MPLETVAWAGLGLAPCQRGTGSPPRPPVISTGRPAGIPPKWKRPLAAGIAMGPSTQSPPHQAGPRKPGSRQEPGAPETIEAEVLGSAEIDEGLLWKLLRRAGRSVARPAIECLELVLDANTPLQVRLTMVAALTYLLFPLDLIPDFIPVAGFGDDVVAMTALLGLYRSHMSDAVRARAQRKLDQWFPPVR